MLDAADWLLIWQDSRKIELVHEEGAKKLEPLGPKAPAMLVICPKLEARGAYPRFNGFPTTIITGKLQLGITTIHPPHQPSQRCSFSISSHTMYIEVIGGGAGREAER